MKFNCLGDGELYIKYNPLTNKCHLKDIIDAEELGRMAAEQTIRKLSPKKIGSEKIAIIFDKGLQKES